MDGFYCNLWLDLTAKNGASYKLGHEGGTVWEGLFGEFLPADCHNFALAWE